MKYFPYRICHLAKYYPPTPGGIETHVQVLAQGQSALCAKVRVLCVNGLAAGQPAQHTATMRERDRTVRVIRLGRLGSLARLDICPAGVRYCCRVIRGSYDVVHLHTPNPTMLLVWLIARGLGRLQGLTPPTLIITHHSDIIRQRLLKYALRPLEYVVYQQATCILTDSPSYLEGSRFLHAFRPKVRALPLGIDCAEYLHPIAETLHRADEFRQRYGNPLWLAVGRLVYYKALHIAIAALVHVPGTLLIMGTGPLQRRWAALARQLGVSDRVIWHGAATPEDLRAAYCAATALWFPSNVRSEGFGLVQIEAMASRCPVINAAIPGSGVPWVSRHEQEGLTVSLNDPHALARAALRLLHEPGLRDRLAQAAWERAQQFDYRTMAHRSLEIYEHALQGRVIEPSLQTVYVD